MYKKKKGIYDGERFSCVDDVQNKKKMKRYVMETDFFHADVRMGSTRKWFSACNAWRPAFIHVHRLFSHGTFVGEIFSQDGMQRLQRMETRHGVNRNTRVCDF